MITPGSVNPLLMAGGRETTPCGGSVSVPSYVIKNSLRFRGGQWLNRASTGPAHMAVTLSFWVKRGKISAHQCLIYSRTGGAIAGLMFRDIDTLYFQAAGTVGADVQTQSVYRDPSAWYHVVLSYDSVSVCNIYVNGVKQAATGTASGQTSFMQPGMYNSIGMYGDTQQYFSDCYMADIHFIDGQALDASAFGEFDSFNGVWQPKAYAGTYGANGFWLKFDDAAQIGKDSSGNNNHWTANNIDVAAPGTQATYDLMKDSPVMFDDGTANPPGNYAILNPISDPLTTTVKTGLQDGNIFATYDGGVLRGLVGNMALKGKIYFEVEAVSFDMTYTTYGGVWQAAVSSTDAKQACGYYIVYPGSGSPSIYCYTVNDVHRASAVGVVAPGDVIGIACDTATREFWVYHKNQLVNTTGPTGVVSGTGDIFVVWAARVDRIGIIHRGAYNFGQRPFKYAPPAGFKALCTTNLPYCQPFDKPDGTAPHNATVTLAANEFKYLGYAPTAANGVTWGTQLDKLSNGVKAHAAGTYTITNSGERFKTGLAQGNP